MTRPRREKQEALDLPEVVDVAAEGDGAAELLEREDAPAPEPEREEREQPRAPEPPRTVAPARPSGKQQKKASGAGYKAIRNVQTLQTLCAQKDRELRELREEYDQQLQELRDDLAAVRRSAMVQDQGKLQQGISGILEFCFDALSEMRGADSWRMPEKRREATSAAFAEFFGPRLGESELEYLPLAIGFCGIGAQVTRALQGEKLARAEAVPAVVGKIPPHAATV